MKITCSTQKLQKAIQMLQKAIPAKTPTPILTGIYMEIRNQRLELQATDYEIGIVCSIEVEAEQPGKIVVPGRTFSELVRKLPGDNVSLYTEDNGHSIHIHSDRAKFRLVGLPVEEYPVIRKLESDKKIVLPDDVLRDLIKKTVYACSNDEARPVFTGVLLEVKDNAISFVATNTHRLALRRKELSTNENISFIIPGKILQELAKNLTSDLPEDVVLSWKNKQLSVSFDEVYFETRLLEGNFPDYNRVIPSSFATRVRINRSDFLAAVERVSLLSKDGDYNIIRLQIEESELTVSSNNPEIGNATETISCITEGNGLEIAFNAKYVSEMLRTIEEEYMTFQCNTPVSPACLKPASDDYYSYIVTPVRVAY